MIMTVLSLSFFVILENIKIILDKKFFTHKQFNMFFFCIFAPRKFKINNNLT